MQSDRDSRHQQDGTSIPAKRKWSIGMLVGTTAATLLCGAVAIAVVKPSGGEGDGAGNLNGLAASTDPASCARQTAERLGIGKRVSATVVPGGRAVVSGYVASNSELATFQNSIKRSCASVTVEVHSDEALAGAVRQKLARHGQAWELHDVTQGRVRLKRVNEGSPPLATLKVDLPAGVKGVTSVEQSPFSLTELQRELSELLAGAELSQVMTVSIADNRIQVAGKPSDEEYAKWEEIQARLQRKYGANVPIATIFDRFKHSLPFTIHQVVSGPMPFIVLEDGSRLFEGGSQDGFRLVSIKENRLVFGGPQTIEITW